MLISIGLLFFTTFILNLKAQLLVHQQLLLQQRQQQQQLEENPNNIVVNNVKLNSQLQQQYNIQNNLLMNLNYGDLMKCHNNSNNDNNISVNINVGSRNDFDDELTVTTTTTNNKINQIIYQQPPQKQLTNNQNSIKNNNDPDVIGGTTTTTTTKKDDDPLISLDEQFDWNFLKHILLQNPSKNVIVSPFSIKLILSILLEAAGNNSNTQTELFNALTATRDIEKISKFWNKTIKSLQEPNKYYDLLFGTKIFVDDFVQPTQKFASRIKVLYDTEIDSLSFKNSSKSADIINEWSSDITKGHIKNIVSDEQLKSSVMLILNAIYFKGKWKYSFDPNESFVGDFYYDPTKTVKAQYMTKRDYYNYMDSYKLNAKIVQIPYEGKRFHLTLLLPKAKGGLEQLIYDLTPATIKKLEWSADDETEVKLTIPKLNFQFETSLKDTLRELGVNEVFNNNASLALLDRGANVNGQLKVSDIYQKSGLQIDETGSTAFSETVAAIENKFGGGIEDFTANRPFLFFIQDYQENKVLFAGKITNPV